MGKMKKINLLYLIPNLHIGGAEELLFEIIRKIDRKKFNPVIACMWDKGLIAEKIEKEGVKVHLVGMHSRFDLITIFRIAKLLKKEKIDVLNTHLFPANTYGRLAGILARTPIIISTEHNVDEWKNFIHKSIDYFLSFFTDKIITVSEAVRNFYIREEKIPFSKYVTIYNGLDLERVNFKIDSSKVRQEFGIGDVPTAGMFCRLIPQKSPEYFLIAAKEVLKEIPDAKFMLVGSGSLFLSLQEKVKELSLEKNFILTGFRSDVLSIMSAVDVVVFSSLREGFSIALLEAMACEKPVVATSVGGNPEVIVDGETGFMVPPKNPDALAKRIIWIFQNLEKAEEIGKLGRKRLEEKFTIEKTVESLEKLYVNVTSLKEQRSKKCKAF